MTGDLDNREHRAMILDAGRDELAEASAHLQAALGYFVDANDVKRVSWLSGVWDKLNDALHGMWSRETGFEEDPSNG